MEEIKKEVNTPGALNKGGDEDENVIEEKDIKKVEEEGVEEEEEKQKKELETSDSSTDDNGSLKPKPVEGETKKETALRRQIERKNNIIRDLRGDKRQQIFDDAKIEKQPVKSVSEDRKKELEEAGYSEEEVASAKKLMTILAPELGFVQKEQAYQSTANQIFDDFLDEHSEYSEMNDEDDLRFNTFKQILASDYSVKGKTPRQLKRIFNKAHRDVEEELGESELKSKRRDNGEILAERQKIQSISHTGGTKSQSTKSVKSKIDTSKPIGGIKFKGFDDEDFD